MPLYGDRARKERHFDERKAPTTKAQYRETIISYMKGTGDLAKQYRESEGRIPRHNPDCLPEWSMTNHKNMPKRMWTVAQEMVADGTARITNGSFETGSVYLVAGPNWID